MVLNHDKRSGTVGSGEGLRCHDGGLRLTLAKNVNGTVMGR